MGSGILAGLLILGTIIVSQQLAGIGRQLARLIQLHEQTLRHTRSIDARSFDTDYRQDDRF